MKKNSWFVLGVILALWPIAFIIHALLSIVTYVTIESPWNPLELTTDRSLVALFLAAPLGFLSVELFAEGLSQKGKT